MRWNKKEVSLSSPELREILRPRSEKNWRASLFKIIIIIITIIIIIIIINLVIIINVFV